MGRAAPRRRLVHAPGLRLRVQLGALRRPARIRAWAPPRLLPYGVPFREPLAPRPVGTTALRLPDLASAVALAAAAVAALFSVRLPADDIWWQVAYGRAMLASHDLPRVDTWSWTAAGHPLVVTEWAFDALMAAAARGGGAGAWTLAFLCFAGAMLAALALMGRLGRNRPAAGLLVLLWLVLVMPFGALLPQLASFGLLASVWWALESARLQGPRPLLLLPVLFLVWTNVHGTFSLGLSLVALDTVLAWAPGLPGRLTARYRHQTRRWLPWALVGSVAVTLLNPYGWHLFPYEFRLATDPLHASEIAQFRSPNFHDPYLHWAVLPALLLALGTAIATRRRLPAREVLAALGLLGGALVMVRILPYGLLGLAAVAASALRRRRPPVLAARWPQLGLVGATVAVAVVWLHPGPWPSRTGLPAAAAAYVKAHLAGKPGFNTYEWGGYLLETWNGQPRVYIDSRGDLYAQTPVLRTYADMLELRTDPGAVLRGENVAWALLPAGSRFGVVLSAEGWRPAYEDRTAIVLLPPPSGTVPTPQTGPAQGPSSSE